MSSATHEPLSIEPSDLLPPLRRMFSSDDVTVLGHACERPHGVTGLTSVGVVRISGTALVHGQPRPWSLIRKPLDAGSGLDDPGRNEVPSSLSYWKRDSCVYRSGLLDHLPHGLAAPRCCHTEDQPDRCVLWLEEIREETPAWPLERYGLAAWHLGLLSGLYLTERAAPDFPWLSVEMNRQKERFTYGFFERMDELRQREIVRRGWPDDVGQGLLHVWREREQFYRSLDGLPRVFQHGDAGRRNLMSRTTSDGQPETVLIDWGMSGVGALGEEIAPTVMQSVLWFLGVAPAQLPELGEIVLDGFLRGLRDAGWRGDPRLPRLGYLCTVALRFGSNIVIPEALTVEMFRGDGRAMKERWGWTIEEWADQLREMRRYVIRCADEARRLMGE